MKILTIDGTHVALVYVKLKMESFEQYYCDETLIVGVNLSSLYKLIKTTTSHDTVVFYVSRDEPNKLGIELQNADENKKTCFKLKLLDIDHNECCIPELEFESVITIPSVYFQRICRDMLKLSETIKIKSNGTNLILSCSGDFAGGAGDHRRHRATARTCRHYRRYDHRVRGPRPDRFERRR